MFQVSRSCPLICHRKHVIEIQAAESHVSLIVAVGDEWGQMSGGVGHSTPEGGQRVGQGQRIRLGGMQLVVSVRRRASASREIKGSRPVIKCVARSLNSP